MKHHALNSNINRFTIKDVGGEGNCFFLSVADQLKYTGYGILSPQELRETAAKQVSDNLELYYDNLGESLEEIENNVPQMSQNGEFADHVLIQGLADALNIKINIFHADGRIVTIEREGKNYQDLGVNVFYHDIHYQSLEANADLQDALAEAPAHEPYYQDQNYEVIFDDGNEVLIGLVG